MHRPVPPLMLRDPVRWSRIDRRTARAVLSGLAALLAALLFAGDRIVRIETAQQTGFHASLVERLRHGGEDYYTAAVATLRGSGLAVSAFRVPAPAGSYIAAMPGVLPSLFMGLLAAALVFAWFDRFARLGGRFNIGLVMIAIGCAASVRPGLIAVPALWTGLLVAIALGVRRPGRWVEAAALTLAATVIHGAAMLMPIVMAVAAWREGGRREALGWAVTVLLGAGVISLHLQTARDAIGVVADTGGWTPAGPTTALLILSDATGLAMLPAGIGLAIVTLATAGWTAWRDPLSTRAQAIIVAALILLALLPADRAQIALIVAPITLLGLLPAIDMLRTLMAAALDSRRITVTRVSR